MQLTATKIRGLEAKSYDKQLRDIDMSSLLKKRIRGGGEEKISIF